MAKDGSMVRGEPTCDATSWDTSLPCWPSMLLLCGQSGRKATDLLRWLCHEHRLVGIEVGPVHPARQPEHASHPPGLPSPWQVTPAGAQSAKTPPSPLLEAGAVRVYGHNRLLDGPREAMESLHEYLGDNVPCVCAAPSLRRVLEPGVFVAGRPRAGEPNALPDDLERFCDDCIPMDGQDCAAVASGLSVVAGRWQYRRRATAIVLAGGRSSRMGRDKALIPLCGAPLIQRVVEQLLPSFEQVLISANDPARFAFLGLPVIPDGRRGEGPMMGVVSALAASEHEVNLVVTCDAPDLSLRLVRQMLCGARKAEAVVPVHANGRFEALFAVYRRSLLPAMREALSQGERTLARFLDGRAQVAQLALPRGTTLPNINTAKDLVDYQARRGES